MIDYIEFIRHLEQKGYPFGTPPDTATQWLANSREPETQRLLQRAKMLDATQEIQSSLQQCGSISTAGRNGFRWRFSVQAGSAPICSCSKRI